MWVVIRHIHHFPLTGLNVNYFASRLTFPFNFNVVIGHQIASVEGVLSKHLHAV
tara:strand:- start:1 stop:162 length:162 start_codon:yes stop_codon:yes gene_type:complete